MEVEVLGVLRMLQGEQKQGEEKGEVVPVAKEDLGALQSQAARTKQRAQGHCTQLNEGEEDKQQKNEK